MVPLLRALSPVAFKKLKLMGYFCPKVKAGEGLCTYGHRAVFILVAGRLAKPSAWSATIPAADVR
jgi:hypothetical protein